MLLTIAYYAQDAAMVLLLIAAVLAIIRPRPSPGTWVKLAGIAVAAVARIGAYAFHSVGAVYQSNGTVKLGPYWKVSTFVMTAGWLTFAVGAVVEEVWQRFQRPGA